MKEELISFKTAKLVKEKGIHLPSTMMYRDDELTRELTRVKMDMHGYVNSYDGCYSAPTQSLLQRWLRERFGINISIVTGRTQSKFNYECWIMYGEGLEIEPLLSEIREEKYGVTSFEWTYEEALEKGLLEALNLIK